MAQIKRVKGTQDFLDLSLFNFILQAFKEQADRYHFTQISTPLIEPLELFTRSLGQQTDVVTKEMFVIEPRDGKADERICLRPEATAATVRAYLENIPATPWKVFSHGPMFRYERPQKGRYRQFHQINMEVIGSHSISQDVQLIKMLDRFFHEQLKLEDYALMINFLGTPQDRAVYRDALVAFMEGGEAQGVCDTCKVRVEKNIMRIFDCKKEQCQTIYTKAPRIVDHLSTESQKEWERLQNELTMLSVTFTYNPSLVRGLDYYNKTVFEFVSTSLGAQNAFCGGGRYDQLVGELGSRDDQPSIGAAIGIERLMLLLEPHKDTLPLDQPAALHAIIPLADELNPLALLVADTLQAADLTTDVLFGDSIKTSMKKANKMGATFALIIGDQERDNKSVVVKNMITGAQQEVKQVDLVDYLKK